MPTKPYSLQSPEQIAKDYAGNKQKIAQAAQSGLLDPTAAVMAGMFIDRMRSAQGQEQGPPSTVAQQVFAPPPPPMQMGAMPPSAPMGAPPQGAPPPPMGAPPVGMAGGGLTTLPLPDNMFNEPDGMGYANGGIVAFAEGGATDEPAIFLAGKYFDPVTGVETAAPYGGQYVAGEFDTGLGSGRRFRPKEGATPRTLAADPASKRPVSMGDLRSALKIPNGGEVYRMGDGYVYADGSPAPAPKPGSTVQRGAQRLIGSGIVGTGREYTAPKPVAPAPKPDRPEGYIPFGGEGTAVSNLLGRMGDESFAAQEFRQATAQYRRDLAAYNAVKDRNTRIGLVGGGKPQPLPPRPVMPTQSDFRVVSPPKKPTPAAKPAASAPATKPATAGIYDLSGGQSRTSIPKGALYRDPQNNIRRNDNADAGNPIITPAGGAPAGVAPRAGVPSAPAAPRVGVPSAPRGGLAPAGPALSASPAAPGVPGVPGVPGAANSFGGFSPTDIAGNQATIRELAPVSTAARDAMAKHYADMSSPEALAAQKKQDFWGSLAQIGFGMAGSNSPYFLQAAGQSASAALPGMQQAAQARRAQVNEGMRGQLELESMGNKEQAEIRNLAMQMTMQSATAEQSAEEFQKTYQLNVRKLEAEIAADRERNAISREGLARQGSGGAAATGEKPLTLAQALDLVQSDPKSLRLPSEQKLVLAQRLVAQSRGGSAATVRQFDPKTGTFK